MTDDYNESFDDTPDISIDVADDSSDVSSELPEDSCEISNDGSVDLPDDNECLKNETEYVGSTTDIDEKTEVNDAADGDDYSTEVSSKFPKDSCKISDDGSENIPEEIEKNNLISETSEANEKDMNQGDITDEEYNNMSPIQKANADIEYAKDALEEYKNRGMDDPTVEKQILDAIKYQEERLHDIIENGGVEPNCEGLDPQFMRLAGTSLAGSIGYFLDLDPISSESLKSGVGNIAELYGNDICKSMVETMHTLHGQPTLPNYISISNENGNVTNVPIEVFRPRFGNDSNIKDLDGIKTTLKKS